jgi:hypothetical protein
MLDKAISHLPRNFQLRRVVRQGTEFRKAIDSLSLATGPGAGVCGVLRGAAEINGAGGGAVVADVEGGAVGADVMVEGFVGVGDGEGEEGSTVIIVRGGACEEGEVPG